GQAIKSADTDLPMAGAVLITAADPLEIAPVHGQNGDANGPVRLGDLVAGVLSDHHDEAEILRLAVEILGGTNDRLVTDCLKSSDNGPSAFVADVAVYADLHSVVLVEGSG